MSLSYILKNKSAYLFDRSCYLSNFIFWNSSLSKLSPLLSSAFIALMRCLIRVISDWECQLLLPLSVGWILELELYFWNTYIMWLWGKNADMIDHFLSWNQWRQNTIEFVTECSVLVWIWPKEKFCSSRAVFYCLVSQPEFSFVFFFNYFSFIVVSSYKVKF